MYTEPFFRLGPLRCEEAVRNQETRMESLRPSTTQHEKRPSYVDIPTYDKGSKLPHMTRIAITPEVGVRRGGGGEGGPTRASTSHGGMGMGMRRDINNSCILLGSMKGVER